MTDSDFVNISKKLSILLSRLDEVVVYALNEAERQNIFSWRRKVTQWRRLADGRQRDHYWVYTMDVSNQLMKKYR